MKDLMKSNTLLSPVLVKMMQPGGNGSVFDARDKGSKIKEKDLKWQETNSLA